MDVFKKKKNRLRRATKRTRTKRQYTCKHFWLSREFFFFYIYNSRVLAIGGGNPPLPDATVLRLLARVTAGDWLQRTPRLDAAEQQQAAADRGAEPTHSSSSSSRPAASAVAMTTSRRTTCF